MTAVQLVIGFKAGTDSEMLPKILIGGCAGIIGIVDVCLLVYLAKIMNKIHTEAQRSPFRSGKSRCN